MFSFAACLILIFTPRIHKILYSKLFAKPYFSNRILSVSKFYAEDIINWLLIPADFVDISLFCIVAYNIFIRYAVLYLLPF